MNIRGRHTTFFIERHSLPIKLSSSSKIKLVSPPCWQNVLFVSIEEICLRGKIIFYNWWKKMIFFQFLLNFVLFKTSIVKVEIEVYLLLHCQNRKKHHAVFAWSKLFFLFLFLSKNKLFCNNYAWLVWIAQFLIWNRLLGGTTATHFNLSLITLDFAVVFRKL